MAKQELCDKCRIGMHRIYIRKERVFVPLGWYCTNCKTANIDGKKLVIEINPVEQMMRDTLDQIY